MSKHGPKSSLKIRSFSSISDYKRNHKRLAHELIYFYLDQRNKLNNNQQIDFNNNSIKTLANV